MRRLARWIRATRAALRSAVVRRVVAAFGVFTIGEWIVGTSAAIYLYGRGGALAVGLIG